MKQNRRNKNDILNAVGDWKMKINTRSWSGVLPISVALDGRTFSCRYDCSFCPNECRTNGAQHDISRSYLSSEGTFKRGLVSDFDPCRQVLRRLLELQQMGHVPDKLEIIVLGGTWHCHDRDYRNDFIHKIFYACNIFPAVRSSDAVRDWLAKEPFKNHLPLCPFDAPRPMAALEEEKNKNSDGLLARIIGIVLETRPDQISLASMAEMRRLGCTRVQLGLQHTDDAILKKNDRGHTARAGVMAIEALKDNGFKVDGHLMPDLPFASPEADVEMFQTVFTGPDYQLDYVKIYPCLDLPFTRARTWKSEGRWRPYAESDYDRFVRTIAYGVSLVPAWTRINRIHRDFPEASDKNLRLGYESETIRTNLQQYIMAHMRENGLRARDIRTREIKNRTVSLDGAHLRIHRYESSGSIDYFISLEKEDVLFGFVRLRLPPANKKKYRLFPLFHRDRVARIRELHVYSFIAGTRDRESIQHRGIGRLLMWCAEHVAAFHRCMRVAVISGVGVRNYYRRLGYSLDPSPGEFMVKSISPSFSVVCTSFFFLTSFRLYLSVWLRRSIIVPSVWVDLLYCSLLLPFIIFFLTVYA